MARPFMTGCIVDRGGKCSVLIHREMSVARLIYMIYTTDIYISCMTELKYYVLSFIWTEDNTLYIGDQEFVIKTV